MILKLLNNGSNSLKTSLFVLLMFFALSACNEEKQAPNIVLIVSDDQGFGDFSFTGNEYIQTPHLDELKSQSLYFDRFYVSPVCAPTRASLMSGRYHLRTGTSWVTHGKEVMRAEEYTLAESLADNGYTTGCFGKWHNGEHYPHNPNGQGFQTFFGFTAGHWNNYFDTKLFYNNDEVKTQGYIADILTDSALNFISRNKEKPFFCYIPYNTPHGPFQVPDKYFDKYKKMGLDDKNAAVYGMCENIDDNVGRIVQHLEELNLANNTILLYFTDNGPNGVRYNAGMKGIKAHVDEGGIRTPLLIRYPGVLPAGDTIFGLASHIDILPTLHALAGLKFIEKFPLDGIDLSEYMKNDQDIPDRLIFTHQVNNKLEPYPSSLRSPQYRLVMKQNRVELYDMIEDPGQTTNIAKAFPMVVKSLSDTLLGWFDDVTSGDAFIPRIPVGYAEAQRVTLPAPEATLVGNVRFKGEKGWANDWLIGFESGDNKASWQMNVVEKGWYLAEVKIAIEAPDQQTIIMIESGNSKLEKNIKTSLSAPKISSPDRVERTEVFDREWPTVELGKMQLESGFAILTVSTHGSSMQNIEIKEVVLSRIEEEASE